MEQLAIIEAFTELPDPRLSGGLRHQQTLCLALIMLANFTSIASKPSIRLSKQRISRIHSFNVKLTNSIGPVNPSHCRRKQGGVFAIGDWLKAYYYQLLELFKSGKIAYLPNL